MYCVCFCRQNSFFVTFSDVSAISNARATTVWRLKWIWLSAGSIMFSWGQSAPRSYSSWLPAALDQGLPGDICFHLRKIHKISPRKASFCFIPDREKGGTRPGCWQWGLSAQGGKKSIILVKEGIHYGNDSHLTEEFCFALWLHNWLTFYIKVLMQLAPWTTKYVATCA